MPRRENNPETDPRKSRLWLASLFLCGAFAPMASVAQTPPTFDGSVGAPGIAPLLPVDNPVTPGPDYEIPAVRGQAAGGNLFHSFSDFNINAGASATFTAPQPLDNVVSRVTGANPSNIDGLLKSEIPGASFWFINPKGIAFGPGAALDVPGSFHVSTGDYVVMNDGARFLADSGAPAPLLSVSPEGFGFLGNPPRKLSVAGSSLARAGSATNSLHAFSMVAGELSIADSASISAPWGHILNLVAAGGSGEVTNLKSNSGAPLSGPMLTAGLDPMPINISTSRVTLGRERDGWEPANYFGRVFIRGGNLVLDESLLVCNCGSFSSLESSVLDVSANSVSLKNGSAIESGPTFGPSADIAIRSRDDLTVGSGSHIVAVGSGSVGGRPGDIRIDVEEGDLRLIGNGASGGTFVRSDTGGEETASGDIRITVPNGTLEMSGGALIESVAGGAGDGVETRPAIAVEANALIMRDSRIQTKTSRWGFRTTGPIEIAAHNRVALDNSSIVTTIENDRAELPLPGPRSGDIRVVVEDGGIELASHSAISAGLRAVDDRAQSGDVRLRANVIEVLSGSVVSSSTDFQATGSVGSLPCAVCGEGGNVVIEAQTLSLTGGGRLDTSTTGNGHGGSVIVGGVRGSSWPAGEVIVSGYSGIPGSPGFQPSGIFSDSTATNRSGPNALFDPIRAGPAGDISISSSVMTVENKGQISAATRDGGGGLINLNVDTLSLLSGGVIRAGTSGLGDAGAIFVQGVPDSAGLAGWSYDVMQPADFDSGLRYLSPPGDVERLTISRDRLGLGAGRRLGFVAAFDNSVLPDSGEAPVDLIARTNFETDDDSSPFGFRAPLVRGVVDRADDGLAIDVSGYPDFGFTGAHDGSGRYNVNIQFRNVNEIFSHPAGLVTIDGRGSGIFNDSSGRNSDLGAQAGASGDVTVSAGSLVISDRGQISATTVDGGDNVLGGIDIRGGISIEVGAVDMSGGSRVSTASSGSGDAGDVSIRASAGGAGQSIDTVRITGGAVVSSATSDSGDAGNLSVGATGENASIFISGYDGPLDGDAFQRSGLFSDSTARNRELGGELAGTPGRIQIRAERSVRLDDHAQISVSTADGGGRRSVVGGVDFIVGDLLTPFSGASDGIFISGGARVVSDSSGTGDAGLIFTRNTGGGPVAHVEIIGEGSGLFSESGGQGPDSGRAGVLNVFASNVTIRDGGAIGATTIDGNSPENLPIPHVELSGISSLSIESGGQIRTGSSGAGDAASVDIVGAEGAVVRITGANSGIFSSSTADNATLRAQRGDPAALAGKAGNVTLRARTLTIGNQGQVAATTVDGPGSDREGGTIVLNVDELEISGGGQVTVATSGAGNAGDITVRGNQSSDGSASEAPSPPYITAATRIEVRGTAGVADQPGFQTSGLVSNSTGSGSSAGKAGDIVVISNAMTIRDSGSLSATTRDGDGGLIDLRVNSLELLSGGSIRAGTDGFGDAGAINVEGFVAAADSSRLINLVYDPTRDPDFVLENEYLEAGTIDRLTVSRDLLGQPGNDAFGFVALFDDPRQEEGGLRARTSFENQGVCCSGELRGFVSGADDSLAIDVTGLPDLGFTGDHGKSGLYGVAIQLARGVEVDPRRPSAVVRIDGSESGIFNSSSRSRAGASVTPGKAGNVAVKTDTLEVTGGGRIAATTVDGEGSLLPGIGLSAGESGRAQSGSIELNVDRLTLSGGARVEVSSFGTGSAGNITVRGETSASGSSQSASMVLLTGDDTGLFSRSEGRGAHAGGPGDIAVTTNTLTLDERARISAANTDSQDVVAIGGSLGSVALNVGDAEIRGGATVSVGTSGIGRGGDLRVRDRSQADLEINNTNLIPADSLVVSGAGSGLLSDSTGRDDPTQGRTAGAAGTLWAAARSLTIEHGGRISSTTIDGDPVASINLLVLANELDVTTTGSIEAGTSGSARGGNIVLGGAFGPGVPRRFEVDLLGGRVSASSSGSGDGGDISMGVNSGVTPVGPPLERLTISADADGDGVAEAAPAGIFSISGGRGDAAGAAGSIRVAAGQISVGNQGQIAATTVDGGQSDRRGDISLSVDALTVTSGSQVTAATSGAGTGGSITVEGRGGVGTVASSMTVSGEGSGLVTDSTGEVLAAAAQALSGEPVPYPANAVPEPGAAGDISVRVKNLRITDGGSLSAGTVDGAGGTITLTDLVSLILQRTGTGTSGGSVSASTSGSGAGGQINIAFAGDANEDGGLQMRDGGVISTDTQGAGKGGEITITINGDVLLDGGIVSASAGGRGAAGSILLDAMGSTVTLLNGATISVSSTTPGGAAGNVSLQATDLLMTGSRIEAEALAEGAFAGNINLAVNGTVVLTSSTISGQSASGVQAGGGFTVSKPRMMLLQRGSSIVASSASVTGGTATIEAETIIFDGTSTVTATGGVFTVGDVLGTIQQLPDPELVDAASRLETRCTSEQIDNRSSLVVREILRGQIRSPYLPEVSGPGAMATAGGPCQIGTTGL